MVSMDNYAFLDSLKRHFHDGLAWDDTEWLQFIRNHGNVKRYENEAQISKRLEFLEKLFSDFKYRGGFVPTGDLPSVNIGRANRISLDDGRHRMCTAIVAGVSKITVSVKAYHPEETFNWPATRIRS